MLGAGQGRVRHLTVGRTTEDLNLQLVAASQAVQRRLSASTSPRIKRLAEWSSLSDSAAGSAGAEAPASSLALDGSIQKTLSRECHRQAYEELTSEVTLSDLDRARIRSAAGSGCGVWLRDFPNRSPNKLSRAEMIWSIRMLLGLPLPGLDRAFRCTVCEQEHDVRGIQRLHHCRTSSGMRTRRHDELKEEVNRWLNLWSFTEIYVEPQGFFAGSGIRPDIVARHPTSGRMYVIDVMVTSPLQRHMVHHTSWNNGLAAQRAEQGKKQHYAEVMRADERDMILVPLVLETYGRLGKEGAEFLKAATNHLHDREEHLYEVKAQLNRILWQGNAQLVRHAIEKDRAEDWIFPLASF
mmetsp:Transcript_6960/g.10274  ORF Transcript_6960/g.10274 Transcript_6960/m.10274 type:complete len:353 (-) Transcript_6960:1248-2306(-)